MSAPERLSTVLLPFPAPDERRGQPGGVLAVVGGPLDAAVTDLALVLARERHVLVDLLLLVEVPPTLPMRAYGDWLLTHGGEGPLCEAEQRCGEAVGDSGILLCRRSGPSLVAEVEARGSTDLVLGMPGGGWWRQWRARRSIAHVQARAGCRVYVILVPPPPPSAIQMPRAAAR